MKEIRKEEKSEERHTSRNGLIRLRCELPSIKLNEEKEGREEGGGEGERAGRRGVGEWEDNTREFGMRIQRKTPS